MAARVTVHLVLGAEHVGCYGARNDLEKVTNMTASMFALYGISPNMEDSNAAAQNLIVLSECRQPTSLDSQRIDQMVNIYLEKQYKWVLNELQTYRGLLDAITNALVNKRILNQDDFNAILNKDEGTKALYSDIIDAENKQ